MRRTILSVLLFLFGMTGATVAMPYEDYGDCKGKCEQRLENASLQCLAQTIFFEAGNQPTRGQVAVAFVVLNRAKRNFKTICEVVHQPGQFYWVSSQTLRRRPKNKKQWESSKSLAKDILEHPDRYEDPTHGATAFRRPVDKPFPKRWYALAQIGGHVFYAVP